MEYIEKILVSRNEIPINLDSFKEAIISDITLAKNIYDNKMQEEYEETKQKDYECNETKAIKNIEEYVNRRFKKEETKNIWRKKMLDEWKVNYKFFGCKDTLHSISWKINPWDNCSSSITYDHINDFVITHLYEQLKDNEFFNVANGWNIIVKCTKDSFKGCVRVVLQLPEEFKQKWINEEKQFNKNMDNFLSTVKYHRD